FQAEDGIRDRNVTGVQTCALPILKINSGDGVARVYFAHESPVEYSEPYDIDIIKDFCMDKDSIKSLEISTSEPILPKNSTIIDTPGIDAADDADRLMTESS